MHTTWASSIERLIFLSSQRKLASIINILDELHFQNICMKQIKKLPLSFRKD